MMKAACLVILCVAAPPLVAVRAPGAASQAPPSDETIRAIVEARERWLAEHRGEQVDPHAYDAFLESTLAGIEVEELTARQLALLVPLIWDLHEYAAAAVDRLQQLAEDEGADGAIAAAALFQLNYMYRALDLEATLGRALTHPGLGPAFEEGQAGDLLSYMRVLPEETLRALKDEVLGVTGLLDRPLPAEFAPYAVGYFTAVTKLGDAVPQDVRERLRARVIELCDDAIRDLEAAGPDQVNELRRMRAFVAGRAAGGTLLDRPAPELDFQSFSGGGPERPGSLADVRGSVVVLDFWATWCGACIEAFPGLRSLSERYRDDDVRIIGVTWLQGKHYERNRPPVDTSGDAGLEYRLMAGFMERNEMTWPVAFADGEAVQDYGLMMTGIPHLTIIDGQGVVRYDGAELDLPLESKIEIIDRLLGREAAGMKTPANMYRRGKHYAERRRFDLAAQWLRKAAAAGHAGAMVELGALYADGHGVPKDAAKAIQWFQRAVELGSTDAMNTLGVAYLGGQDADKAVKARALFEKGAALGDATSMYNLSRLYKRGFGLEPDEAKALEWLRKAARAGSEPAQRLLEQEPEGGA